MNKTIFIYLMIVILLISGLVLSKTTGLSDVTMELYNEAIELEDTIENQVWKGYKISEYPIAIRKGNKEYVLYNGEETKREAALDVYACTAAKVNGEINIFVLSFEEIDSIINPAGMFSSKENKNYYIATIYHEGLHAYQWKSDVFEKHILNNFNSVFDKIDNDETIKKMYEHEMEILYNGISETDSLKKISLAKAYINEREKRNIILKERLDSNEFQSLILAENQYELIEGTAHYIELKTLETLNDIGSYQKQLDSLKYYHRNNIKYYKSGMGISLLLDEFDKDWKGSVFINDKSLFEKLKDAVGGKEIDV